LIAAGLSLAMLVGGGVGTTTPQATAPRAASECGSYDVAVDRTRQGGGCGFAGFLWLEGDLHVLSV
jgi:hypothetical protein